MDVVSTLDCSSWAMVENIVTCTYCKGLLKKPCTLICCHTFCYSCIQSITVCPICHLQPNKYFSFKLLHFENYFLARLTKVFAHKQNINQSCTNCIHNTKICKRCYVIGCIKCNSQKLCTDNSREHLGVPVNLNKPPEELLHHFSGNGYCEEHEASKLNSYCYTCEKMRCSECLQSCTNHKTSKIDNPNKSIPKLISLLDEVKQEITTQECAFVQHREKLDELFKEDFNEAAQWFNHVYNCLYHEKQNTIFRLKVFQSSLNKRIETFLSDLESLTKFTNDFQTYFTLLLDKSSDDERRSYKEKTLQITYRETELKKAIQKIANQFENNFNKKKVFQKFFTLTHTCEGVSICDTKCKKVDDLRSHLNTEQKHKLTNTCEGVSIGDTKCKKVDDLRSHLNTEQKHKLTNTCEGVSICDTKCKRVDDLRSHLNTQQKYKLEVISYCQARDYHDRLKTDQVTIQGNCYSMFSLPLTSSEVVKLAKQSHMLDISKCASCVSQLKLYNKTIAQQNVEKELKDKGYEIYETIVISSVRKLLVISNNSISSIEKAILHLHEGKILMYFREIEDNLTEFENFAKRMEECRQSLQRMFSELKSFQCRHMGQLPNKLYSNILIDIIFDCETYIAKVYEAVIKINCIKEKIKLWYSKHDECTENIISEGFQVEIVSHYSNCVALNEICKSSVELINNWIK